MAEPVQLLHMKQYALNRLSNGDQFSLPKSNGVANGGTHANGTTGNDRSPTSPTQPNGFITNKGYGDWDSNLSPTKDAGSLSAPSTLPRQPTRGRPSSGKPAQTFIPEHEIDVPADGSLRDFNADDMSTFLRYMGVEERIVTHVHKKGLDGHKFAKLKDSDLEALGMKNPIICHFRNKSGHKEKGSKKKAPFML